MRSLALRPRPGPHRWSHRLYPRIRPAIAQSHLQGSRRTLQTSRRCQAIRTQTLGDVGEGITECMLNMWFVEEGARVEEWDKLCEMQSDKAAVEISVNYSGVIKKLHAHANDMVKTGAPLADIDDGRSDEAGESASDAEPSAPEDGQLGSRDWVAEQGQIKPSVDEEIGGEKEQTDRGRLLATPAVRGLLKEHNIDLWLVRGSGKDGRVLKEDVQNYLENRQAATTSPAISTDASFSKQTEESHPLTPVQAQMFRTMTASLSIPHFLYTDEVNITSISRLRRRLNETREKDNPSSPRLTLLPFILKAVSLALNQYPLLNARIADNNNNNTTPHLIHRSHHNIGIATDTPTGLLVPVLKNVASLSIPETAREIKRLAELGQTKKLSSADLSGGTITVSNIGSIGGTVVAPVIVDGQVAILGVGKARVVSVFRDGLDGVDVERAEVVNFSWSADHRVVDGATMARMANKVKGFIEVPERLLMYMR